MKPWKVLERAPVVTDRWLRLTADRCELADGQIIEPFYVVHDRDWVHVFAQTDDGRVLVVRQYRHAAGALSVELPGGVAEEGESPLDAAKRELLEETGYVSAEWVAVGSMFADPGRQTNSIHVFLAKNARKVAEQDLDHGEELGFDLVTMSEIEQMIAQNDFSHSQHVASFYRSTAYISQDR